tara:strand:- start:151 stop:1005 length:855 start_codon:yes stop_codon:yes gene_type:complete
MKRDNNIQNKPTIICVALTGSVPRKKHNNNVPISVNEQIESAHECFEEGATIAHCHVRNKNETVSYSPEKFLKLKEGLRKHCKGMVIQFSTGGRYSLGNERGRMLSLKPDMASLSVGSNNFPNSVYSNPPELIDYLIEKMNKYKIKPEIEIFDLSHLFKAAELYKHKKINGNPYIQFVMGIKNAMPADKSVFNFYIKKLNKLFSNASWCAAGIGKYQLKINEWCIKKGGHTRTGMEDNIRLNKNMLAPSNASLVKLTVDICKLHNRPIANWRQTRQMLELPSKF